MASSDDKVPGTGSAAQEPPVGDLTARASGAVLVADEPLAADVLADDALAEELLVEEISIDGMCGVY